jgi:hypothetical protein
MTIHFGFWILDFGFWIPIPNLKPPIPNPKSQISNLKSQISNPKSQISNPKSKIQNPKSVWHIALPLICLLWFGFGSIFASAQAQPDSAKREPARQVPLDQQVKELRQKLSRELGPAGVAEDENPLLQVARQMQQAQSLSANPQPGAQTKQVQEQIVANLDRLLESCKNSSSSPGGQCTPKPGGEKKPGKQGNKPGSPGPQPNPKPTNSGAPAKNEPAAGRQDAADVRAFKEFLPLLPQRERDEIQASSIEEFLPKYKSLIEAYFRDLMEEQNSKRQE